MLLFPDETAGALTSAPPVPAFSGSIPNICISMSGLSSLSSFTPSTQKLPAKASSQISNSVPVEMTVDLISHLSQLCSLRHQPIHRGECRLVLFDHSTDKPRCMGGSLLTPAATGLRVNVFFRFSRRRYAALCFFR